jgi:DNA-binding GntR family transcriptional regulator
MASADPGPAPSDQDIYDRIFEAILDRRLPPGAHLRETELAETFRVSRTKVRQALAKLAQAGLVTARASRGVAVAKPSREQARDLLELRRLIEPSVAARVAEVHRPAQLAVLQRHIARENQARAAGDEPALIRLTGEFHQLLAGLLGNVLLDRTLNDIEALTCLAILAYARPGSQSCLPDEHQRILDAIARRDGEAARALMNEHLVHVWSDLDLGDRPSVVLNLAEVILPTAAARRRPGRRKGA